MNKKVIVMGMLPPERMVLAAALVALARTESSKSNSGICPAEPTLELELDFTKLSYDDVKVELVGKRCKICGQNSPFGEKFCSTAHRFEWKRRGR